MSTKVTGRLESLLTLMGVVDEVVLIELVKNDGLDGWLWMAILV